MVHLGKLSLAGTGIVFSGVLLGAVLGTLANPVPKPAPPPPWTAAFAESVPPAPTQALFEPLPEDLSPRNLPDGYAPAFASGELSEWPEDPGMAAFADLEPIGPPEIEIASDAAELPPAATARAEQAAEQAAAAVEDAQAAQAAAPAEAQEPSGGARLIQVADAAGA